MKYTLKKDWVSPGGSTFKKGRVLDVTRKWIEAIEATEVIESIKETKKVVKTKKEDKDGDNSSASS